MPDCVGGSCLESTPRQNTEILRYIASKRITVLNDVNGAEVSWMSRNLNTLKMVADRSSNNRMCKVRGNSILTGCVRDHLTK